MGRIKTTLIKRITMKLLRQYKDEFNTDYSSNKKKVNMLLKENPSKKIRNTIAGYVTRLMKKGDKIFIKIM